MLDHNVNTCKVVILGNYTIEYIAKELKEKLNKIEISNEIYVSGYGQFNQEILDSDSKLYQMKPDFIFVLLQGDLLFKHIYKRDFLESNEEAKLFELEQLFESITMLLDVLLTHLDSTIIMNNFVVPFYSPLGILDNKTKIGLKEFVSRLNRKLVEYSLDKRKLFIYDYNALIAYHGFKESFDYKMNYLAKVYEKKGFIDVLCENYLAYINSSLGLNKKCLVLDLDNTLWGGVVNEDGIEGIKLDIDGLGKCYWDFQNKIYDLYQKGVILAICSKNNYEDAINVLENHQYMVLKKEHFSSMKINWSEKYINIKAISEELNIGLDSMVFIDDSPFERDHIRKTLPMVQVPDLPSDTAKYSKMLQELTLFESLNITKEDKLRNEMYASNLRRNDESKKFENVDDYLKSLNMELIIDKVNNFNLPRIHQLINKTNQFNMTTKRYTLEELSLMMNKSEYEIYSFSLTDKFGDNGIIGVVILKYESDTCLIDTFLLSCRILGRRIERAILNFILNECRNKKVSRIEAEFVQTQKNTNVRYIYKEKGFKVKEENEDRILYYIDNLSLNTNDVENLVKIVKVFKEDL